MELHRVRFSKHPSNENHFFTKDAIKKKRFSFEHLVELARVRSKKCAPPTEINTFSQATHQGNPRWISIGSDFSNTPNGKRLLFEGIQNILQNALLLHVFLNLVRFSHSRSRGVQKMKKGIEFFERERRFLEKTLQTRAGRGGAHRIPRNAERIENGCRAVPTRFGCLGAAFTSHAGQR